MIIMIIIIVIIINKETNIGRIREAPVIGAKTDGVKGFCGGLVQGVVSLHSRKGG